MSRVQETEWHSFYYLFAWFQNTESFGHRHAFQRAGVPVPQTHGGVARAQGDRGEAGPPGASEPSLTEADYQYLTVTLLILDVFRAGITVCQNSIIGALL